MISLTLNRLYKIMENLRWPDKEPISTIYILTRFDSSFVIIILIFVICYVTGSMIFFFLGEF